MSEPMKTRRTNTSKKIKIIFSVPGQEDVSLVLPGTPKMKKKVDQLKQQLLEDQPWDYLITPWEEATPWEEVSKNRVKGRSKAGIALRGARYRVGYTQKELAKRCGISQENLSKMENGKRAIGKQTAGKLAKALKIPASLLCS